MSIDNAQLPLLPSARKKRLLKEGTLKEPRTTNNDSRSKEQQDVFSSSQSLDDESKGMAQEVQDSKKGIDSGKVGLELEAAIDHKNKMEQERISRLEKFSSLPPLPATTTTSNLMHYLSTTTRFINTFAASTNESCIRASNAIDDLEVKMSLLESKINSMTITTMTKEEEETKRLN